MYSEQISENPSNINTNVVGSMAAYAANITADTPVDDRNVKPLIAPLDSAFKTDLDTMLWCYLDVIST